MHPEILNNNIIDKLEDFRVDKNFAHNIDAISRMTTNAEYQLSPYDAKLFKNFIYYVFFTYERNMFNFGKLDPYDFAERFDYKIKNLIAKHPDPLQLRGKSQKEIEELYRMQELHPENRVYDSYLENILFFMVSEGCIFPRGFKTTEYNGDVTYTNEIKQLKFLNSVTTIFVKGKRGHDKIMYRYELNSMVTNNLITYYLRGSKATLIELRSENLDDLYLYLKNLREDLFYKGQTIATPEFEFLCSLAGIKKLKEDGEPYEPKYRKRDLIKSLSRVQNVSDFKFKFEFVKGKNQKWAYSIKIYFESKFNDPKELEENLIYEKRLIQTQAVFHELIEKFREKYGLKLTLDNNEDAFFRWVKNPHLDVEIKKLCFRNGYFKTNKKIPSYIDNLENNFLSKLPTVNSVQDLLT